MNRPINNNLAIPICRTCTPKLPGKNYVILVPAGEEKCKPVSEAQQIIDDHADGHFGHLVDLLRGVCR